MPMRIRLLLAAVILLVFFGGWSTTAIAANTPQVLHRDADAWAVSQYQNVASLVMPSPIDPKGIPLDITYSVTARVTYAHDFEPEIQFTLTKYHDSSVVATVTRLRVALREQLVNLYEEHRDDAVADLAALIKADGAVVTDEECPGLSKIVKAFEGMHPPVALTNRLMADPTEYQLWVDAGSEQLYVNLLGPSSGGSRHPVIEWIEKTQGILLGSISQCSEARNGKAQSRE